MTFHTSLQGYPLDVSSAGALRASLADAAAAALDPAVVEVLTLLVTKPMQARCTLILRVGAA